MNCKFMCLSTYWRGKLANRHTRTGFSFTFEVEGHWLVSSQVPVKVRAEGPNL